MEHDGDIVNIELKKIGFTDQIIESLGFDANNAKGRWTNKEATLLFKYKDL